MTSNHGEGQQAEHVVLAALDSLGPSELEAAERHIESCEVCAQEFAAARDSIARLAGLSHVQPPSSLRRSVLKIVDDLAWRDRVATTSTRSSKSMSSPSFSRPRRARRSRQVSSVFLLLAVAGALLVSVTMLRADDGEEWSRDIVLRPVGSSAEPSDVVPSDRTIVRFLFNPETGKGVLTARELSQVPDDKTYRFWLIDDDRAEPVGDFRPDADGSSTLAVEGRLTQTQAVGVTVEPTRGSEVTTGTLVYTADLT